MVYLITFRFSERKRFGQIHLGSHASFQVPGAQVHVLLSLVPAPEGRGQPPGKKLVNPSWTYCGWTTSCIT